MKTKYEKWFGNGNKVISLRSYKGSWDKPDFWFHTNGAKRKNGDKCFDFNIHFFYLAFSYTNFNLQNQNMKNLQIRSNVE